MDTINYQILYNGFKEVYNYLSFGKKDLGLRIWIPKMKLCPPMKPKWLGINKQWNGVSAKKK